MAQSPTEAVEPSNVTDYLKSWDALGSMITRGSSFSGFERNRVFLNQGQEPGAPVRRFANVSASSGGDLIDDGRGLAITDWDGDGDLDIWTTNRTGPRVRFLRNDIPGTGHYVSLRLQGVSSNRDGIGARINLTVKKQDGNSMLISRSLRAGESFLSQSSKVLTVGFPDDAAIDRIEVRWPGQDQVESFSGGERGRQLLLVQGTGIATPAKIPARTVDLKPSIPNVPTMSEKARIVFFDRPELPAIQFVDFKGNLRRLKQRSGRMTLVNLWASWCSPCLAELAEFKREHQRLQGKGIDVVAFSTEVITEDGSKPDISAARKLVGQQQYPFELGLVDANSVRLLTLVHNLSISRERPLPLPSSFLVDSAGKVAILYKGPVTVEQIIEDSNLMGADLAIARDAAFPFPGKNGMELFELSALKFAQAYQLGGYMDDARDAITSHLSRQAFENSDSTAPASAALLRDYYFLGTLEQSQRKWSAAAAAYFKILDLSPNQISVRIPLGVVLWESGEKEEAERQFAKAEELGGQSPALLELLGKAQLQIGHPDRAVDHFSKALSLKPEDLNYAFALAASEMEAGNATGAVRRYQELLTAHPDAVNVMNSLAWNYATHPDVAIRNTAEALRLAEGACRLTNFQNPATLDTLAAAYANTGKFAEASDTIKKALALTVPGSSGRSLREQGFRQKLSEYKAGRPWRQLPDK
ncbi:MAG: Flp pilus assembly protein TadD/thiol-disulfide isomerase/thioredoxin [Verrucomicrobiales bacterium]